MCFESKEKKEDKRTQTIIY